MAPSEMRIQSSGLPLPSEAVRREEHQRFSKKDVDETTPDPEIGDSGRAMAREEAT